MSLLIDNGLKCEMYMAIDISLHEAIWELADCDNREERLKILDKVEQYRRLMDLGHQQLDCGLKEWNWNYCAEKGLLCDMDFQWFKKDLDKANINFEEHKAMWKKRCEERRNKNESEDSN